VSPRSGRLRSGEQALLTVEFDSHGLLDGDHQAQIQVHSNDPDEEVVIVPALLHAIGAPDIAVAPPGLAFGNVFVGAAATRTLTVSNAGTAALTVSGITTGSAELTAAPSSFVLQPYGSMAVTLTFAPTAPAPLAVQVVIASDDPDQRWRPARCRPRSRFRVSRTSRSRSTTPGCRS
jgi:hypothetical protein